MAVTFDLQDPMIARKKRILQAAGIQLSAAPSVNSTRLAPIVPAASNNNMPLAQRFGETLNRQVGAKVGPVVDVAVGAARNLGDTAGIIGRSAVTGARAVGGTLADFGRGYFGTGNAVAAPVPVPAATTARPSEAPGTPMRAPVAPAAQVGLQDIREGSGSITPSPLEKPAAPADLRGISSPGAVNNVATTSLAQPPAVQQVAPQIVDRSAWAKKLRDSGTWEGLLEGARLTKQDKTLNAENLNTYKADTERQSAAARENLGIADAGIRGEQIGLNRGQLDVNRMSVAARALEHATPSGTAMAGIQANQPLRTAQTELANVGIEAGKRKGKEDERLTAIRNRLQAMPANDPQRAALEREFQLLATNRTQADRKTDQVNAAKALLEVDPNDPTAKAFLLNTFAGAGTQQPNTITRAQAARLKSEGGMNDKQLAEYLKTHGRTIAGN